MPDSKSMSALRKQLIALLILLLSLSCFLLITFLRNSFVAVNANVNSWAVSIQSDSITEIAKVIHYVFSTTPLVAITLSVAAYLFYRRHRNDALFLVAATLGVLLIVSVVKWAIHSPRPLNWIIQVSGFSYPSGHIVNTVVLLGALTYLIWQHFKSRNVKILSGILFVLISLLVGFDRIYLNVHWFSDVLGAYSLGIFWLTFCILAFRLRYTS